MLLLTLLLICSSALASVSCIEKPFYASKDAEKHFEYFMKTYNKHYDSESEKMKRFEIFKQNLKKVNRINADPKQKDAAFGITIFSDLTSKEFKSKYATGAKMMKTTPFPTVNISFPFRNYAPANFDWRSYNVITPVKNQGQCGACWAFSTIGGLEAAYAIKNRQLISLSEQQLVDCDSTNSGCGGGHPNVALNYLQTAGSMGEYDYPYMEHQGQCRYNPSSVRVRVAGQAPVELSNEAQLREILSSRGPISILINSSDYYFQHYTTGVYYCPVGDLGHAVLLVGYGVAENGVQYWLIKNSWGTQWGEAGYIRVRAGNNPCGMYNAQGVLAYAA